MTQEERDAAVEKLTEEAVEFILDRLDGYRGVGWRRTSDLKDAIYGWLQDHGIFEGE